MKTLLPLVFSLSLVTAFGCKQETKAITNPQIKSGAIVGGTQVDPKTTDTSYIVSLGGDCAGSIINARWILTAAHCEEIFDLPITGGSIDLRAKNRVRLNVKTHYIHPEHVANDWGDSHDFALIELSEPIDFAKTKLSAISIADAGFEAAGNYKEGVMTTVLGWGTTRENGNVTNLMRQVDVPLVSNERANATDSYNGHVDESMIAAGYDKGGKDSCQGDSGGPLVIKDNRNGKTVLAGIVSFGEGCARAKYYGIYSKVSFAHDWIVQTIQDNQ
jgi:trypsin